ncbi:hypothetical protein [Endothiovibrio diazotrophicus]
MTKVDAVMALLQQFTLLTGRSAVNGEGSGCVPMTSVVLWK